MYNIFPHQNEEMARLVEARAKRRVDRTLPLWKRRGWVDPGAVSTLDRAAPVRTGDRLTGVASCIAVAATAPAWNGSGYPLTATPCDPARRWTITIKRTPIRIWWTVMCEATRTMNRPDQRRAADRRPRLILSVGNPMSNYEQLSAVAPFFPILGSLSGLPRYLPPLCCLLRRRSKSRSAVLFQGTRSVIRDASPDLSLEPWSYELISDVLSSRANNSCKKYILQSLNIYFDTALI